MEHITDGQVDRSRPTAITLGNFDGLHLGHRALIQLTKEFAAQCHIPRDTGCQWKTLRSMV